MSWKECLSLLAFGLFLYFTNACTKVNRTCSGIKTADGYRYVTNSTVEILEIEVTYLGTNIATGRIPQQDFRFSDELVSKLDKSSVTTHKCHNLQIKLIYKKGTKISDLCEDFIVLEDENPEALTSLSIRKRLCGVAATAALIAVVCGLFKYISWKRNRQKNGQDATLPVYLTTLCQCKKGNSVSQEGGQGAEEDNILNTEREEQCLLNGKSDSPRSNGDNMDVSINMDSIITANDDKGAPQVNGVLLHDVGQNGNKGHDPGGGKANTRPHCTENCPKGGTLGEQSSEHDKDKEQHLPHGQGSAGAGFDETAEGGGQELVHSSGPGSDDTTPSQDEDKTVTREHHLHKPNNI